LCASLRQSWVRHDKVGAFTSIRELSHLFPDLLPPPEEERNGSNKANYYEELTIRPQAGLNSIVVGYLRTVRKFLMQHNPKDYRQQYNTILNAGFILRKPRLRLSHDLVVARRWLFESQMDDEESVETETVAEVVTPHVPPPAPLASNIEQEAAAAPATPEIAPVQTFGESEEWQETPAAQTPNQVSTGMDAAFQQEPHLSQAENNTLPESQQTAAQIQELAAQAHSPSEFSSEAASAALQQPAESTAAQAEAGDEEDDDYDPLAVIERSWQLARFTAENKKPLLDPAASAAAAAAAQQASTPPVVSPPTPAAATEEIARPAQTAYPVSQPAAAQTAEPVGQMQSSAQHQAQVQASSSQASSTQAVQANTTQTAQANTAQAVQANTSQTTSPASPSTASSIQNAPTQRQQKDNFVFDEKQLRKPEADIELPAVIRLLEAAHLITKVEVQALKAQMQLAPNISAVQLCINAGYVTATELASLRLAENLLSSGKITMAQFQVAMYDERTSGLRMAESLQVRGWLDTEVRNSIEEFKKNNS
jgi:hypothetical protein